MPPTLPASGPVRSAAVVNEQIRALVRAAGGRLYGADRVLYAKLVEEWDAATAAERRAAVVRAEVVEAA
jgi:hypothetical protein